jgi:dolichol-phosphate mannosyltransferase
MSYNEEKTIRDVVEKLYRVLSEISEEFEIIIVDDGSNDNSRNIIKELLNDKIRAIFHDKNLGIGEVLRSGYFNAKYDYVFIVPADGQFDTNELYLIKVIPEKTFISFYRENLRNYGIFRKFLTFYNNVIINRIILGIKTKDVNWVKVFPTNMIKKLNLKLRSSLIQTEICAKLERIGYKPIEIPSKYLPRKEGKSKTNFKIIIKAFIESFELIYEVLRFKLK